MKKVILSVLAVASFGSYAGAAAHAGQTDDVLARIEALEKKVAALSEEKNAALRENQVLRQQNAVLKPATRPQATAGQSAAAPNARRSDPLRAYASAPPMAYKGPVAETRGQLRIWGEGGATWTGGDPDLLFFNPLSYNYQALGLFGFGSTSSASFDLKPRLGWEGATGFDYRFAGSPWHVSGQFRYGEGKATGSFGSSGGLDPVTMALLNPNLTSFNGSQTINADGTETHWLADLAIGHDVLGSGRDAMQLKAGLRISEFTANTNSIEVRNITETFSPPDLSTGIPISAVSGTYTMNFSQRSRFLGAGPRIGIEGSVPFAGGWTLDYMGDAAALFGSQRFSQMSTVGFAITPAFLGAGIPAGVSYANTDQRFNTVFNADLQVGVSYWVSPNVKVSGSYRLDAYFNVLTGLSAINDPTKLQTMDRYIHGPRVGVSALF